MAQRNRDIDKAAIAMAKAIPGHNDVIAIMFTAAIAGKHVALLGPPGEAKSMMARRFADSIGGKFFESMLMRTSVMSELYGPVSVKGIENDKYVRVGADYIQDADVAFVDETFNGSSVILNSMLSLMNERKFQGKPSPLKIMIGASNNLPDGFRKGTKGVPTKTNGDDLRAFWDRFSMRVHVYPIKKDSELRSIIIDKCAESPQPTWDLARYQLEHKLRTSDDSQFDDFLSFIGKLGANGIMLSTRRKVWLWEILHGAAIAMNEPRINNKCYMIAVSACWTTKDQIKGALAAARDMVDPKTGAINAIVDSVVKKFNEYMHYRDTDMNSAVIAMGPLSLELKNAVRRIREVDPTSDEIDNMRGMQMQLAKHAGAS